MVNRPLELGTFAEIFVYDFVVECILLLGELEELLLWILHLGERRYLVLVVGIARQVKAIAAYHDLLHDLPNLPRQLSGCFVCLLPRLVQVTSAVAAKRLNSTRLEQLFDCRIVFFRYGFLQLDDVLVPLREEPESLVKISPNDKWALLSGREQMKKRQKIAWLVVERRRRQKKNLSPKADIRKRP